MGVAPRSTLAVLVAIAAIALVASGCATRGGAPVARVAEEPAQPRWPPRHSAQARLEPTKRTRGVELVERSTTESFRVYEAVRASDDAVHLEVESASSIVSLAAPAVAAPGPLVWSAGGTPRLLMVVSTDLEVRASPSAEAGETSPFADLIQQLLVGVRTRSVSIAGPTSSEARGICVLTPGLGGTTAVETGLRALALRGWLVVELASDALRGWRTRQRSFLGDPTPSALAARIDAELFEDALVAEAVLALLVAEEPALAERPLVLVGSSLGAIGLPAMAARIESIRAERTEALPRVSGAVLVGGGAGLADLLLQSPVGGHWLRLAGLDGATVDRAALAAAIDADCALAPERCLWALDGRPVLLIDAMFDAIVPRRSADRLWRALGEPERWSHPVGHLGLYVLAGGAEWERAVDWIDAITERTADPAASADPRAAPDRAPSAAR